MKAFTYIRLYVSSMIVLYVIVYDCTNEPSTGGVGVMNYRLKEEEKAKRAAK